MPKKGSLEKGLRIEQLASLAAELQIVRDYPPLVSKGNGKYEGDILGFVKGLRISARIIYYLREQLSDKTGYEVNWGHLVSNGQSCSPECDVIVHRSGHMRRWDGNSNHSIMDFCFIPADRARVVVSCKSKLATIDKDYPKTLKKYGVNSVFLLAECCKDAKRYNLLRKRARSAGYAGLYCLYFVDDEGSYQCDEKIHSAFVNAIRKVLK